MEKNDNCKVYQQYELRDKVYTFTNDSYQNYRFLKNAYYKVDIRFIYNTYWKGGVGDIGRHSIVLTNIRKHQDDKYVKSQKDDIIYDNVKIIREKCKDLITQKLT